MPWHHLLFQPPLWSSQPPVKADVFSSMGPFTYISPSLWQVLPCPTFYLSFRTQVQLLLTASQAVFMPLQPVPCPSSYLWRWSHQWPLCGQIQQKLSTLPSLPATLSWGHSLLTTIFHISSKFPWLPGQCSSFGPRKVPWRDVAMIHYPPVARPAGGMRASVLTEGAGQCPPHSSNSEGLKPNSFGPDHSTSK